MKTPHKHAMFIKAGADGEVIEVYDGERDRWVKIVGTPTWTASQYRIQPEPPPDKVFTLKAYLDRDTNKAVVREAEDWEIENIWITFDGATGHLKKVEKI